MQKLLRKIKRFTYVVKVDFYLPKQTQIHYSDQFKTQKNQDGTLQQNSDTQVIRDVDDKYGLEEIRDFKTILVHLKQSQYNYTLNELIYFLRHLTQLCEDDQISNRELLGNNNFKGLIDHVKQKLKSGQHERYPYLGSYAYCFQKLRVTDKELWLILEEKVLNDEYYTNFKESVYAVQGFTQLPQTLFGRDPQHIQERVDKLYIKLERIVRLTIWEVDPIYYQKIATALAKVNRFDKQTFDKLEQHIITNLSLEYQTRTMVDILLAFSKGKQGSLEFYNAIQYVIFKGHMFNRNPFLKSQIQIQNDGYVVSGLMEIYNDVLIKHNEFELHPNFQSLVHQIITNKRTTFDLTSSIKTLTLLPMFQFEDNPLIIKQVFSQIMAYQGSIGIDEMLNFYQYIEEKLDFQKNAIPYQIFEKLEEHFLAYTDHYRVDEIWNLYNYLFQRPKFITNSKGLQQRLIYIMDNKLLDMNSSEIESFQAIFKESIKLTIDQQNNNQIQLPTQEKSWFQFSLTTKPEQHPVQQDSVQLSTIYNQTIKKLEDIKLVQKYQESMKMQISQKSQSP